MTSTSQVGSQVRRFAGLPDGVAQLTVEVSTLRDDVAAMRADVIDLGGRLSSPTGATASGAPEAGSEADSAAPEDGIELLAERMAVLEDGLDEVCARLESLGRDGINQVSTQLRTLVQRIDELAARPTITAEQLEQALARAVEGRAARLTLPD